MKPTKRKGGSALVWLWLSAVVVLLDQITKYWASHALQLGEPLAVTPFLNFTLMHNTGAAFSILADAGGWQRWFFVGLSAIVGVFILVWMHGLSRQQHWLAIGLALILAGAVGNNLLDRLILGYVVDFIDVYYQSWHWPAFNIADSAISIGAVLLVVDALFLSNAGERV